MRLHPSKVTSERRVAVEFQRNCGDHAMRECSTQFQAQYSYPFPAQNPFYDDILNGTNLDAPLSSPTPSQRPMDSHDDAFSDLTLTYISQMLMDEDDRVDSFHEYAALQATEKPFYDILAQKYPSSTPIQSPFDSSSSSWSPDDSISPNNRNSSTGPSSSSGRIADGICLHDFPEYQLSPIYPAPADFSSSSTWEAQEEYYLDGLSDLFRESEVEARRFLPSENKLVIDSETNGYSFASDTKVKPEKEERGYESKGRKNPHGDESELEEGRNAKQSAFSFEDTTLRSEALDETLLFDGCNFPKAVNDLREAYHIGPNKGSSGKKGRWKKQREKEVVDLTTLLTQCAQMAAADDRRGTGAMLKQIRQHSSPVGDGSQRLAHYVAVGLEARLAGTGSEVYNSIKQNRRTAMDFLKAYQLYLAVCPIRKISYYFSNQHIMDIAEKATRIHVVDFGIGFGFQWPSLIQRLSLRANGPPKLRITGIDFPQPGFRPRERLDETGRRLADYAKLFNVAFEYKGISSRWEDVRIEDLNLDEGEVLAVNCLFMFRYLADETVSVDCPRSKVLNTIRKMKPDVFIHGITNGSFNAPFFVTRFREALYFYSAIFDMLETNVPREDEQRLLSEREIFGRELINIIACEGSERVERPETYRQWQARNLRAGFVQRPLNREMFKKAKDKVQDCYHKDFLMDEDGRWLLQGWKGRTLFALSSWKPNDL